MTALGLSRRGLSRCPRVYAYCYRVATTEQRKSPPTRRQRARFTLKRLVAEGGFEPPTKGL